ncbi:MAG: CHRD domain-containing protein [Chitinophagaceae bacterium]|nr:CHRD domain-containing protein [Chitinophagaceae bacterium]
MTTKKTWLNILMSIAAMAVLSVGCDKDDDDNQQDNTYTLSGTASGEQEVPAVTTSATGNLSGTYNADNNTLTYTISWTGLSGPPILMHFHGPALPGASAGPVVTITGFAASTSGSVSGTATLTETEEADLLAGKWYYNIHTDANGGGEIRGQVTATP